MIEKILDRLERIDHKEYCGGFEFADSSTFEEMGRCFDERKQLANYTKELQQENKQLKGKIDKAIEYINENKYENTFRLVGNEETGEMESLNGELLDLLEILGDKENENI